MNEELWDCFPCGETAETFISFVNLEDDETKCPTLPLPELNGDACWDARFLIISVTVETWKEINQFGMLSSTWLGRTRKEDDISSETLKFHSWFTPKHKQLRQRMEVELHLITEWQTQQMKSAPATQISDTNLNVSYHGTNRRHTRNEIWFCHSEKKKTKSKMLTVILGTKAVSQSNKKLYNLLSRSCKVYITNYITKGHRKTVSLNISSI